MNDLERLIEFLEKAGVIYTKEKDRINLNQVTDRDEDLFVSSVRVESVWRTKNVGYDGFYTIFIFDKGGNLTEMGAYE
jgi:hypothetical protein